MLKQTTFVLILFISLTKFAFAGENIVTSKTLAIKDVQNHVQTVMESTYPNCSVTVFGVHQNGNSASVYFQHKLGDRVGWRSMKFVRFNSGKWFCTGDYQFLTK